MTIYTIYRQKEYIKYFSTVISKATLFQIIFSFLPLFVSLISAYRAYGFYETSSFVLTQPTINLKTDMILKFLTSGSLYQWSNLMPQTSTCLPTLSVTEMDANYDGIKEAANISIRLYKKDVIGLRFLLQFDYLISGISKMQLQQPILINVDAINPMGRVGVVGRLGLFQTRRLPSSGTLTIYNTTLFNSSSNVRILKDAFNLAITNSNARNYTVKLKDVYTSYESFNSSLSYLDINILILYNPEVIQFHTEFWSMVKWAWVQWFYFLVMFMFCFQRFKEFVYSSYTISARMVSTQDHQCDASPTFTTEY